MAVAWQATGTLLGSTGADITPVIPSHLKDDILVVVAWSRDGSTCTTPAGWTHLLSSSGGGVAASASYKRATSAAETNPLLDWAAATADHYGVVHTFRGALKVGNPFTSTTYVTQSTDPGSTGGGSLIDQFDIGSLVICIAAVLDNLATGFTVTTSGDPASLTQRSYTTVATGSDAGQGIATANNASSTSAATLSWDFTGGVPGLYTVMWLVLLADPGGAYTGPAKWVASGTIAASTGADVTPTIPTHQANDYLILVTFERSLAANLARPAGWRSPGYWTGLSNSDSTAGGVFRIYARVAMSSAETNPLCDFTPETSDRYALVYVIRGSNGFDDFELTGVDADPAPDLSITTLTANSLFLSCGISGDDTATAVDVNLEADTVPQLCTTHSYTTTTTGADAGAWAATATVAAIGLTDDIEHAFTGSPAAFAIATWAFSNFPNPVIPFTITPYIAHGRRK